jgi:hypothetical protein
MIPSCSSASGCQRAGCCIGEAPPLNQDQDWFRSEPPSHSISPNSGSLWLLSFPLDKIRDRPRPLHSKSFPFHHSPITVSLLDYQQRGITNQNTRPLVTPGKLRSEALNLKLDTDRQRIGQEDGHSSDNIAIKAPHTRSLADRKRSPPNLFHSGNTVGDGYGERHRSDHVRIQTVFS